MAKANVNPSPVHPSRAVCRNCGKALVMEGATFAGPVWRHAEAADDQNCDAPEPEAQRG